MTARIEDGGPAEAGLVAYDAGLLNTYGGGDVDWWLDYIRAELANAHEFYEVQYAALDLALFTQAGISEATEMLVTELRAEITRLRAENAHWQRQAEAAQNNATLFQQDCAFHVTAKARKDEALRLTLAALDDYTEWHERGLDVRDPPSLDWSKQIASDARAARMPAE